MIMENRFVFKEDIFYPPFLLNKIKVGQIPTFI